jgi:hypothetical protein
MTTAHANIACPSAGALPSNTTYLLAAGAAGNIKVLRPKIQYGLAG